MNPLVKKEIRLLLPSWIVAMLLAMVQAITRPYNFYIASLLFFGLTIMALTTIGREASLNTFSSLLAQPAERLRIWQTKLSVLSVAFLTVFVVWLFSFGVALLNSSWAVDSLETPYNLFITICLIATATFTGGLWTTLLLRQLASAFWLTLLVPAVLSGFSAVFLAQAESKSLVIAVMSVVIAVYSVGGFLFARGLFFRAQDVGWSGGNIVLPEWKVFSRSVNAVSLRNRKPVFALVKKEFQLQEVSLFGAAGLLVLHLGVILLRKYRHFDKDSAGEALTAIFWMLWLVMAPVIGSMAVAEERRLGVMEGQLCLPVSRRLQFFTKGIVALGLGIFLGGGMPMLLEYLAASFGAQNPMIVKPESNFGVELFWLSFWVVLAGFWLTLLSFFASTLSRNFLQAVGLGIATVFITLALLVTNGRWIGQGFMSVHSILPAVIGVPTIIVTLLWLAYLNYKNFRPGWPLWQRNVLGFAGAFLFVITTSAALYNRSWEIFEPTEPPHGSAKLSLANPPTLQLVQYENLLVRLPDGRIWFDRLGYFPVDDGGSRWKVLLRNLTQSLPESIGPQRFVSGSNWVTAVRGFAFLGYHNSNTAEPLWGYLDTVGLQPDGSLWVSDKSQNGKWSSEKMQRFGYETNWQQLAISRSSVVLLKSDGTLWRWGLWGTSTNTSGEIWPGLRAFTPLQIGTNANWAELFSLGKLFVYARQADGRAWRLDDKNRNAVQEMGRATNFDEIVSKTASSGSQNDIAFVRPDGTLWVLNRSWDQKTWREVGSSVLQVGKENDWRTVAVTYGMMVALKSDGSLWQWHFTDGAIVRAVNDSPTRLGIHNDWVAITGDRENVITLAADGSVWLWPDKESYDYRNTLIKLPKQPELLGNVFGKAD